MPVDGVGNADLVIGALLRRNKARVFCCPLCDGGHVVLDYTHHAGKRLADDAVKRDQDGEGYQRPEAAGHGAYALLLIELHDLLLVLLLIAVALFLQLLELGLDTGGAHHALFALGHEGHQNEIDDQSEEDYGNAIAVRPVIEDIQQPGEWPDYIIP